MKYLLNSKFTKQFLDFKYFLNKPFTMKEAQNHFKFKGRHLDRVLTLYKQSYLSRRKIDNKRFIYRLTKKYSEVYGILNSYQNNPTY